MPQVKPKIEPMTEKEIIHRYFSEFWKKVRGKMTKEQKSKQGREAVMKRWAKRKRGEKI